MLLLPEASTDINARLLAPALERHLKCTVVVVNKAGAGGMVGTNDFYNSSPKDGLTLMISMEGLPLAQALGAAGVRFDCRKFGWIAGLYKDSRSLQVAVGSPYKSLDDLRKLKQAKAAVTSVTSPAGPQVILAIEALNLENAKLVKGYPGSTEIKLALMRLEADFTVQSKSHIMRKDSFMRPLITVEEERDPDFPDLPALPEMKIKPEMMKNDGTDYEGKCLGTRPDYSSRRIEREDRFPAKGDSCDSQGSGLCGEREEGGPLFKPDVRRKNRRKRGKGA